jgi:ATP-dependent helicase/nuclease subunit B
VSFAPTVLLVPSMAAKVELPRRLASTGRAVAGLYAFKVMELAQALAEPVLLGHGLGAWDTGHDALLAARLLADDPGGGFALPADLPRAPVAVALAKTLAELRRAGVPPERLERVGFGHDPERLQTAARLYRAFHSAREGRVADPATVLRAARDAVGSARWLTGTDLVVVEDLELDPLERELVEALGRALPVRMLRRTLPPSLRTGSFREWAHGRGFREVPWEDTPLAPLAPPAPPPGIDRLRGRLFEPPSGEALEDGSVELLTAPGEAAEVRTLVRRLLREAGRGVPFEDMGVVLPQPQEYAALFTDLLTRLGVPHRLHPSLPLRFGRAARSLLLLFRCRDLPRAAVMEFLTFAPVPFEDLLGDGASVAPARWDELSRDAQIVSGLDRWMIGLRYHADQERQGAEREADAGRRDRRRRRAADADALLRVVEILGATLDALSGDAPWPEWSDRLRGVCDQWIGPERDRVALLDVVADLGGLGAITARAAWKDVEQVVEARLEWERLPLAPLESGAVHVGAMDAMAGLPFRVVAIPGLVEGGYPGVVRPDPFLLDPEREALDARSSPEPAAPPAVERGSVAGRRPPAQLSLFDAGAPPPPGPADPSVPARGARLPTTQDRVLEARRMFQRAVGQATERLLLSYPRADSRTGRERMPSLFFVAAASALAGRPVAGGELAARVAEDDVDALPVEDALDPSERDRIRVRTGGRAAAEAIAAGSTFFKQSRLAAQARWSGRLTRYDGYLTDLPAEVAQRLDPLGAPHVSASRLATWSRCGFQYLLQYVLRLEAALEPEERKKLEPLERGSLFHEVAEAFLRERRDGGELPVRNTEEMQERLLAMAEGALEGLVAGSPPRFLFLWEREKKRFRDSLLQWLGREAATAGKSTPAHFEVSFGLGDRPAGGEPHLPEPLLIALGNGRELKISGKIDRIDRRADGSLVIRDYKTGKAPRDEGGLFRGGKQLQIPFYILAAARLFPGQPVTDAFLDYVDGGRQVAVDPAVVTSDGFRSLLEGLVDAIAQGLFVQEPSVCDWCDYTAVCGPKPLLERRRQIKRGDENLVRVLRLRDMG